VLNGLFLPATEFGKYVDLGSHKTIVAVSRSVAGIVLDGCLGVRFFRPNIDLMARSVVLHPPLSLAHAP
jgi:hypothetical protein